LRCGSAAELLCGFAWPRQAPHRLVNLKVVVRRQAAYCCVERWVVQDVVRDLLAHEALDARAAAVRHGRGVGVHHKSASLSPWASPTAYSYARSCSGQWQVSARSGQGGRDGQQPTCRRSTLARPGRPLQRCPRAVRRCHGFLRSEWLNKGYSWTASRRSAPVAKLLDSRRSASAIAPASVMLPPRARCPRHPRRSCAPV
jgi:hypothetical protein